MRLYEAMKLASREKNPNTKKFMDTLYKVTQVHPFDHNQRISWDGKSTIELRVMGDHINLVAVQSLAPEERTGSASGLVATAVEIAKETGVKIRLSPKPFGTMPGKLTKAQLVAWYKRKGFVPATQGEMEFDPALTEDYDEIGLEAPKGEGSITGYIVDTGAEQLENYFINEHGVPRRIIDNIRHEFNIVAVLRNFSVDEDYRGQGHGTELIEDFMVEAIEGGAEAVLLIADNGEELPFDLEEWYAGWGFSTIAQTSSGPFMVYRSAG